MRCIEEAIGIDDGYARAYAYKAYFYAWSLFSQWAGLEEADTLALSRAAIQRALELDRTDPFVLQRADITNLMIGSTESAARCADAAARVSACDSEILIIRGLVLACCGNPARGVELLESAVALERGLPPGCASALAEGRTPAVFRCLRRSLMRLGTSGC